MAGRARTVWRRATEYVKYDLKETLLPSSMPDPPGFVPPPPRTLRQQVARFLAIVRRYIDTWDKEKLQAEIRRKRGESSEGSAREEPQERIGDLLAEFGVAARGGSEAMKPFLQRMYKTRTAAYRDSVQQFIDGYKEGFQEALVPEPDVSGAEHAAHAQGQQQQQGNAGVSLDSAPPPPPPAPLDRPV